MEEFYSQGPKLRFSSKCDVRALKRGLGEKQCREHWKLDMMCS